MTTEKGEVKNHAASTPGLWSLLALCAAGNLLLLLGTPPDGLAVVSDPTGATWRVRDIPGTSAIVSIFTMGAIALLAWARLANQNQNMETPSQ